MMNQEDIFKKIGQILNELNDQYQYLAQNSQELNELELELFLANANFLTDHVQIIRKLNKAAVQKSIPEHTEQEQVVLQPVPVPALEIQDTPETELSSLRPSLEEDIFKPDNEPSPFEFILNEKTSDKFEFEEKSIDEIFDRPLSEEEALIIAQKQKLREKDSLLETVPVEEDEIGPEPFLVAERTEPQIEGTTLQQEAKTAYKVPASGYIEPLAEDLHQPAKTEEQLTASITQPNKHIEITQPEASSEPEAVQPVAEQYPVQTLHAIPVPQELKTTEETPETLQSVLPAAPLSESVPASQQTILSGQDEKQTLQDEHQAEEKQAAVKLTLNDILSGNTQARNFNTENTRSTLQDLKHGINLNDKLRYIKDLFNGYNLAYAEAIDLLNKMPDFKSADYFLQKNYAVKNNWADRQETADQFYELLHQRFPEA